MSGAMSDTVTELLDLLDIEQLELNLFRGIGVGGETSVRIFGGHVIAQALAAAYRTVEGRLCHSLHAYFMRPGDPSIPVIYEVDRARDGGSFTTRRVIAIQNGRQIFNMAASFHVQEESWPHQHRMPDVPGPEGLETRSDLREREAEKLAEDQRAHFLRPRPIEIREVEPQDQMDPKMMSDVNNVWFRLARPIDATPEIHHCLLAYASDMNLLGSSLRPHGVTWITGGVMTASLDHAMWLHGPIQFDQWHLYSMDAPFTGGGRGFNRGSIYSQDGVLVASVAQEGLVRPITKK